MSVFSAGFHHIRTSLKVKCRQLNPHLVLHKSTDFCRSVCTRTAPQVPLLTPLSAHHLLKPLKSVRI
jgi:hypothetical protein